MNIKIFSHIPIIWHNIFRSASGILSIKFLASTMVLAFCTWVFVQWNTIKEFEDYIEVESLMPNDDVHRLADIHLGYDYSFVFDENHIKSLDRGTYSFFHFKELYRPHKANLDSIKNIKMMLDAVLGRDHFYFAEQYNLIPEMDSIRGLYYVRFLRYNDLKHGNEPIDTTRIVDVNDYKGIIASSDTSLVYKNQINDVISFTYRADSAWDYGNLERFQTSHSGINCKIAALFPDSLFKELLKVGSYSVLPPKNFKYREGGLQYEYYVLDPLDNSFGAIVYPKNYGTYRPHILSMYDISRSYFSIYVRSASIDTLSLHISFNGAANLYPLRPEAKEVKYNGVFYDEKLNFEWVNEHVIYAQFPEMEGVQQVRTFLLGAILTLFLTLSTRYGWAFVVTIFNRKRKLTNLEKDSELKKKRIERLRIGIPFIVAVIFFITSLYKFEWGEATVIGDILIPLVYIYLSFIVWIFSFLFLMFIEYLFTGLKKIFTRLF